MDAKIKVNYIDFVTNGIIKSERLVTIFEKFRHITTFPDEAEFRISIDKFHSEQSGKSEDDMEKVMQWYSHRVGGKVMANRVEKSFLILQGRATKMPDKLLKQYKNIALKREKKCKVSSISFNPLCEGEKNACGYGCVKNCLTTTLYLAADGYLYVSYEYSYDTDNRKNFALCHILEGSIFDAMLKWNADCEKGNGTSVVKIKEDSVSFHFFIMESAISYFKINLADAYENNNIKKMEECATVFDYCIEKWNNYLTDSSIKQCSQTIVISEVTKMLLTIYKNAYIDAMMPPFLRDKKVREIILDTLRYEKDINEIMSDMFISYATKDLDGYIEYFDKVVQWNEKNSEQQTAVTLYNTLKEKGLLKIQES